MKPTHSIRLLWSVCLLTMIFVATGCHKSTPTPPTVPTISSFIVSSSTMTSATFTFDVKNATSLSIAIDGGSPVSVTGTSYTANSLSANKSYTATLTATNSAGSTTSTQSFTTPKSTLAITEFKVTDTTATGATFAFTAASNATITADTLVNDSTGEAIVVTGQTSYAVTNLGASANYKFTLKVADNTGNEVSQQISFTTKDKASDYLSIKSITYGDQFAIVGNALGSKLTITLNNSSSSTKTLTSLTVSFGQYGSAVKMLRYSLNGGSWVVLPASNGQVTFSNISLQAGDNSFECYFALKPNVGVANGSALSFSFTSMDDGSGGKFPKNGWQSAVAVGTVDAVTQPTIITTNWNGYMYGNIEVYPVNSVGLSGIYQSIALKATGPTGARFASIKLKNPYTAFSGMVFGYQDTWLYSLHDGIGKNISTFSWQNDYVTLSLPNGAVLNTDGTNNDYYFNSNAINYGPNIFNSGDYTPGKIGFLLTSKYDIVFINSSGQVIDLSDEVVKNEDTVLQN